MKSSKRQVTFISLIFLLKYIHYAVFFTKKNTPKYTKLHSYTLSEKKKKTTKVKFAK